MPDTRNRTRTISLLIEELALQLGALDTDMPGNEHVCRMMFNTVAMQRNILPLMHPRDRKESA